MMENELTTIRRKDRAITDDAWIAAFLQKADYGVFATCNIGQPFTVARNFAYDAKKHVIYFHGAREGRTFRNVGDCTPVNLNVREIGEWIVADRAMNFGVSYRSVVVFGNLTIENDIDETNGHPRFSVAGIEVRGPSAPHRRSQRMQKDLGKPWLIGGTGAYWGWLHNG
jgi:nitroimidazol reductase NimA-like FMN-containing flavoprotein (pyridoxamine 5'-phosphate oxidase superfamily)